MKQLVFFCLLFLAANTGFSQPYGSWSSNILSPTPMGRFIIDSPLIFAIKYDIPAFSSRSTDQGATWDSLPLQIPYDTNFKTINFAFTAPKSSSFFIYNYVIPHFMASYDSGRTWIGLRDSIDGLMSVTNFIMSSDQTGLLVYLDSQKHYHAKVTHDACKTFTEITDSIVVDLFSKKTTEGIRALCADSLNWIIWKGSTSSKTHSQLMVTHNGGANWKYVTVMTPSGDSANLSYGGGGYHCALNDMYVIAPSRMSTFTYYSTNYGDSWNTTDTTELLGELAQVVPLTHNSFLATGWLVKGDHSSDDFHPPAFYYTTDAGKHWKVDSITSAGNSLIRTLLVSTDSLHAYAILRKLLLPEGADFFLLSYSANNHAAVLTSEYIPTDYLYPNPSTGIIHIPTWLDIQAVRISNILGVEVYHSSLSTDQVDISNFPDGIYMAEFKLHGETIRQKIIKKHQ